MSQHVCPWWIGYLLASPLRKLRQNPEQFLKPHICEGMKVLDYGSAMGFFSIPAARITGDNGKVICMDIQKKMLGELEKRAKKRGLGEIIQTYQVNEERNPFSNFNTFFDCALAVHVIHEVPDREMVFKSIHDSLKAHGRLLFAEPAGHVTKESFKESLECAGNYFTILEEEYQKFSHRAVLIKKER